MRIDPQTLVENLPTALITVERACELAEDYLYKPAKLVAPALISKLQNISLFAQPLALWTLPGTFRGTNEALNRILNHTSHDVFLDVLTVVGGINGMVSMALFAIHPEIRFAVTIAGMGIDLGGMLYGVLKGEDTTELIKQAYTLLIFNSGRKSTGEWQEYFNKEPNVALARQHTRQIPSAPQTTTAHQMAATQKGSGTAKIEPWKQACPDYWEHPAVKKAMTDLDKAIGSTKDNAMMTSFVRAVDLDAVEYTMPVWEHRQTGLRFIEKTFYDRQSGRDFDKMSNNPRIHKGGLVPTVIGFDKTFYELDLRPKQTFRGKATDLNGEINYVTLREYSANNSPENIERVLHHGRAIMQNLVDNGYAHNHPHDQNWLVMVTPNGPRMVLIDWKKVNNTRPVERLWEILNDSKYDFKDSPAEGRLFDRASLRKAIFTGDSYKNNSSHTFEWADLSESKWNNGKLKNFLLDRANVDRAHFNNIHFVNSSFVGTRGLDTATFTNTSFKNAKVSQVEKDFFEGKHPHMTFEHTEDQHWYMSGFINA